ncbi:MAG: hypothetical protein DWG75_03345 [Chloroflexi bacterium]|nr:hypothetical protein [Chloroflexota bacterium]
MRIAEDQISPFVFAQLHNDFFWLIVYYFRAPHGFAVSVGRSRCALQQNLFVASTALETR